METDKKQDGVNEKKQEEVPKEKSEKAKPKHVLPTSRISFQKQLGLLRAWGAASGTNHSVVTTPEVATVFGIHPGTASLANPFFEKSRLLKRSGRGFLPAPEIVAFNSAHKWQPEAAAQKLGVIFRQTWFANCLLPRLAFNSLTEVEAVNILGEAAVAEQESKPQLKMLLEFLQASGVIRREGNNIFLGNEDGDLQQNGETAGTQEQQKQALEPGANASSFPPAPQSSTPQGGVQFSISMKVDMKELSGWQPDRIAKFFEGIAKVLAAKGDDPKGGFDQ